MLAIIEKPKIEMATAKPQPERTRVDIKAAYKDIMKRYPKTMAYLGR